MVVDEIFMIEDLNEIQNCRESLARQTQINDEYSLYKCFCKLCGIKFFEYSSLLCFLNYCKENSIKLL